jgi:hypothetical protein
MTPDAAYLIVFGTHTKHRPSVTPLQSGEAFHLLVQCLDTKEKIQTRQKKKY